jgi:hypothetical protein
MAHDDPCIVIGPDGTVIAATGDLPAGLVDVPLEKCEALSPAIRETGIELLSHFAMRGIES